MYFKMARTAVTVVAGAAVLCLGAVPAALAAPAHSTEWVRCNAYALHRAIKDASFGDTLNLARGCTYHLPAALPGIMTTLTIVGHNSTLTRTRRAGDFSLLRVDDWEASDVTVINVNFTDGGGRDVTDGGAIDNEGTLHVRGGGFSDNEAHKRGGAIYNDGDLTVSNATFAKNQAPYGGAIYNEDHASIYGSVFAWNNASTPHGHPGNSAGGAIFNEDHVDLAHSIFVVNSTDGHGGAIYTEDVLRARYITVIANHADFSGGGIYNDHETAAVSDSLLFGNQPNNCHEVSGCL
jgi:predicted outer membrane repeat protein